MKIAFTCQMISDTSLYFKHFTILILMMMIMMAVVLVVVVLIGVLYHMYLCISIKYFKLRYFDQLCRTTLKKSEFLSEEEIHVIIGSCENHH